MSNIKIRVLIFIVCCLTFSNAFSDEYKDCEDPEGTGTQSDNLLVEREISNVPYTTRARVKYGRQQFGAFIVNIGKDGRFETRVWFSQGDKTDGDTFGAGVVVLDENYNEIVKTSFSRGINGRGAGKTKVTCQRYRTMIGKEDAQRAKYVKVQFVKHQKYRDVGKHIADFFEGIRNEIIAPSCSTDDECDAGEHCLQCGKSRQICRDEAIQCCHKEHSMVTCNTNSQKCSLKQTGVGERAYFCENM